MKLKLKALALGATVALTMAAAPVQAEKKVLLKLPVWFGTHLTGLGSTPKWLAENVNVASGGSLKIKIYEPGKLIPPKEMLDSISKGQINAGYTTPGYNTGKVGNKGGIFSAVPFGPDAPEFLAWIYYGDGRQLWQEMYDKAGYNVHSIPCGIIAPETSGWFS